MSEDDELIEPRRLQGLVLRSQRFPAIPLKFFLPCFLGVMMIMGGYLIFSWASFLDDYDQDEQQEDLMRTGWALSQTGGIVLASAMLSAGFLAQKISQNTRLGLILGATLVIGLFLVLPHPHYYYWALHG